MPPDLLLTPLEKYSRDGRFTGTYAGPRRDEIEGASSAIRRNLPEFETPRLSGIQIKAPMCLDADGSLSPSTDRPFTHILKPAGTSGFETLPILEWLDMRLGRASGLKTPATGLVPMPDGMPAALIVERFDIRSGPNDRRLMALEDICSVLDLPSVAKYDGTMERVARAVRPLSTSPDEDILQSSSARSSPGLSATATCI